jgi:hypothetical protein
MAVLGILAVFGLSHFPSWGMRERKGEEPRAKAISGKYTWYAHSMFRIMTAGILLQ